MARGMSLTLLPDAMAICRLDAGAPLPAWAISAPWWSITRTAEELSVVCAEAHVPARVSHASRGWRRSVRWAAAARSDRHPRQRHRAARRGARVGVRAGDLQTPTTC